MLLSSGVTTMYLGWTKSRAQGLREAFKRFLGVRGFRCNLFYFNFSKFSFIHFSLNYASIQRRDNYAFGVDKVQGPRGLREPLSDFLEFEVFPAIYIILFFKIFH